MIAQTKSLSSWPLKPLKEITTIVSGSTPRTSIPDYWEGDIPWATPKDLAKLDSIYIKNTEKQITKAGYDSCSATMMPPGTVLFSSRAPIGYIAITKIPICTNQGFKSFVPKDDVDSLYLFFCLKRFTPHIQNLGRGATFAEISKELIGSVQIPLPPLPVQKKIAAILEKADQARRKRQEANRLIERFLQSAFLEIFGDPIENCKQWKNMKMKDVCMKITDGTHHSPPTYSEGIPYITAKNIKEGYFDFDDLTYVSQEDHEEIYKRCDPATGDVLYIKDGVTTGIAKYNDLDYPFSMLSSLALLRPNREVLDSRFLEHFLNLPSIRARNTYEMKGGAIKRLAVAKIMELKIYLPPLAEQKKIAALVEKVETCRKKQRQSEQELESLFQSLMQKAFTEELAV